MKTDEITLDKQFPYLKKVPDERYKDSNKYLLLSSLRMINVIRYIIRNKCVLEHRKSLDDERWETSTIREFLYFATGIVYKKKPEETGFQDYLSFWRIKTKPTQQEIYDACHVK